MGAKAAWRKESHGGHCKVVAALLGMQRWLALYSYCTTAKNGA